MTGPRKVVVKSTAKRTVVADPDTVVRVEGGGSRGPKGSEGDKGDKGDQGAQGVQGPPGLVTNASFTYTQNTPDAVWIISHPLTFRPNVTIVDSGGTTVEGEIEYLDSNTIEVAFSSAFAGTAYLS